jgi:uncharacterized membrane protein
MGIIPRLMFVLVIVVAPILVWTTSAPLPARVATHFANGGQANGWMTRDGYVMFMLLMTTALPLVVVALTGFIPRIAMSQIAQGKRAYWLTPERREATLAWLASHACAMGVLLTVFLLGIHLLTIEANERTPARLDESAFFAVLIGFIVLLVIWIVTMALRFARMR